MEPSFKEQIAQAERSVTATMTAVNIAEKKIAVMEAERAAAERALFANVEALLARVATLEATVRSLQMCTVQQFANGRLYFPVGDKFVKDANVASQFGYTPETIDLGVYRAQFPQPYSAGDLRPAGQVVLPQTTTTAPRPYQPAPTGNTAQSLSGFANPGSGARGVAASNGMASLRPGSGTTWP